MKDNAAEVYRYRICRPGEEYPLDCGEIRTDLDINHPDYGDFILRKCKQGEMRSNCGKWVEEKHVPYNMKFIYTPCLYDKDGKLLKDIEFVEDYLNKKKFQ